MVFTILPNFKPFAVVSSYFNRIRIREKLTILIMLRTLISHQKNAEKF